MSSSRSGAVAISVPAIASDRKSGSAGMPRPISYAVFCLKKNTTTERTRPPAAPGRGAVGHADAPAVSRRCGGARVLVSCFSCSAAWRPDIAIFFFNDTATTEIYTVSLHDALPIYTLVELLNKQKPTHMAVYFDTAAPTER